MDENRRNALSTEYGEVCSNFRTLTDIRFKLLGLLPIATAVAIALKVDHIDGRSFVFSLFGLIATIGLVTYNTRNDELYDELVRRAAYIERSLGLADGAFANRPRASLKFRLFGIHGRVDHRVGIGTIYLASIAVWLFLVLTSLSAWLAPEASVLATLAAFGLAVIATWWARTWIKRKKKRSMRKSDPWPRGRSKGVLNRFVARHGGRGADRFVLQARGREDARNHRQTGSVLCRNRSRLLNLLPAGRLKGTGCMSLGGATHGFATAVAVRLRHKSKRRHAREKSRIVPAPR